MPKATAVFDADDSRLSGALARINGKMLALQSRIAKFAGAFIALRAVAHVVEAGFEHFHQALETGDKLNDLSANAYTSAHRILPRTRIEDWLAELQLA